MESKDNSSIKSMPQTTINTRSKDQPYVFAVTSPPLTAVSNGSYLPYDALSIKSTTSSNPHRLLMDSSSTGRIYHHRLFRSPSNAGWEKMDAITGLPMIGNNNSSVGRHDENDKIYD